MIGEEKIEEKIIEEPQVILVDFDDCEVGRMGKEQAHREAKLHRAFSVFLYRDQEVLMQKRALGKYHSGGLWTNTCCSHPRPGETIAEAAIRRLHEETGIWVKELTELYHFFYYAPLDNGFTEFECDHVLVKEYDGAFQVNQQEVEELRWISCEELEHEMLLHPASFTPWLFICAPEVIRYIKHKTIR